jgi:hypothetical protein
MSTTAAAEIEINVPQTSYDGEHMDAGGTCRLCLRRLPTSYWCEANPQVHPGGVICIDGVHGRYVDAYEGGGWEYELDRVYWRGGGLLDADERDLFHDEIHDSVVEWLRGRG